MYIFICINALHLHARWRFGEMMLSVGVTEVAASRKKIRSRERESERERGRYVKRCEDKESFGIMTAARHRKEGDADTGNGWMVSGVMVVGEAVSYLQKPYRHGK